MFGARGHALYVAPFLALGLLLAGCGDSAPTVTPPQPTGRAAAACAALDEQLPTTVDGSAATAITPDSPYTAAWGDIVLTCGRPAANVPADAQLFTIQDVDWFAEPQPQGGTRFTTVKRRATVSVLVPSTHTPPANALVDLGPSVKKFVPQT